MIGYRSIIWNWKQDLKTSNANQMKPTKQVFQDKSSPSEWFEIADELNHSVKVLYNDRSKSITDHKTKLGESRPKPTVSKSYFLLAGYTIENLIKAILIIQNPTLIYDGKIDNSISRGHNLVHLCYKIVDLDFNSLELDLIKILTE